VPTRFVPDAAADPFVAAVDQHRKALWGAVEGAADEPWFLGARFSAIDLYLGTMTRWEPGPAWFAAEMPRLAAIGARARADDRVAAIFSRHFPGD
jgi:GST-like protein